MINNLEKLEELLARDSDSQEQYFEVKSGYIFADAQQLESLNQANI